MPKYEVSWTELHQAIVDVNDRDYAVESAQTLKEDTCIHIENLGCEKVSKQTEN